MGRIRETLGWSAKVLDSLLVFFVVAILWAFATAASEWWAWVLFVLGVAIAQKWLRSIWRRRPPDD